jgi:aromatic-L-amino-acid/L-tryptophan decarboxylase
VDIKSFQKEAHKLVDWMCEYLQNVEKYPVKSKKRPNEILNSLPQKAPQKPQAFTDTFSEFEQKILPGITHWQHPQFFAYFPANSSPPSILGEMLMATLGVQGMSWQTSPAATELEQIMCDWLKPMLGLPSSWHGSIQSTASESTLSSLLTAMSKACGYKNLTHGLKRCGSYTTYCSEQAHSSVEKAVKISGLGIKNLRLIPTDTNFAMDSDKLLAQINKDIEAGYTPLWITASLGTTGSTSIDPLAKIGKISKKYDLYLHIDAAFAGSALICEEYRYMIEGIEDADSFVFNPHKWLLTNFDCSIFYVKDKQALLNTFAMNPPYLQTNEDSEVNNYRDWGIPLGRRFRALKLWFVINNYGVEGLQKFIRHHCALTKQLLSIINKESDFELMAPAPLNLICFRYHPPSINQEAKLASLNKSLMDTLNASGTMYLTHTLLNDIFVLRLCIGAANITQLHVEKSWQKIIKTARGLID